jgi:hypothetical protein
VSEPEQQPTGTSAASIPVSDRGSFTMTVKPGYREVPGYPVTEDDLEDLSTLDTQAQIYFALASFCASFCVGVMMDGVWATTLTPEGAVLRAYGPWVFGTFALAFGVLGWLSRQRRSNRVERIKRQTKHTA